MAQAQTVYTDVVDELAFVNKRFNMVDDQDKEFLHKRLTYLKSLLKYYTLVLTHKSSTAEAQELKKTIDELMPIVRNKEVVEQYHKRLREQGFQLG